MLFLSAQPDDNYFIWQLEIQLLNFFQFKIDPNNIHVLVAYEEAKGINKSFKRFSESYSAYAKFYYYPDRRKCKNYISSIRPHIIAQHFSAFPELEEKPIFYHDSDIVFTTSLPDFDRLCADDNWYFSDARSYLDSRYIRAKGPNVLREMCEVIGIDANLVIANDNNAGGAQAIIKNVNEAFWIHMETDCVNLYNHLKRSEPRYKAEFVESRTGKAADYVPIASWCADMWALLWNSFKNYATKIDEELDFCWPPDDVEVWANKKIFHNAGIDLSSKNRYFYKGAFNSFSPYDNSFDFVSKHTCSFKYVEKITEIGKIKKYDSEDVTFIVVSGEDSNCNIDLNTSYLKYRFGEQAAILSYRSNPSDDSSSQSLESFVLQILPQIQTSTICLYDGDTLTLPVHLDNCLKKVKDSSQTLAISSGYYLDRIRGGLRKDFVRNLDIPRINRFLVDNENVLCGDISSLTVDKEVLIMLLKGKSSIRSMFYFLKEIVLTAKFINKHFHLENIGKAEIKTPQKFIKNRSISKKGAFKDIMSYSKHLIG
ncbi:hypothetical protein ACTJKN_07525 [Pedobacter sp. 22163]|uniref:hypothetical protein n=1 Tax=Pedobacter sp. 22163 TaxID=3453883 RepID=UPI003F877B55